jgi:hypothetical protein
MAGRVDGLRQWRIFFAVSLATLVAGIACMLVAFVAIRHGTASWKALDLFGIIFTFIGAVACFVLQIRKGAGQGQA